MKKIKKYVEYELNIFRSECNFTEEELDYFNYKAKGFSNIRIASEMCSSPATVTRIGQSVSGKIEKVISLHGNELV